MFGLLGILIGIFLWILGGYLIFFFPQASADNYQPDKFAIIGIVAGFIFLMIGALLIFVW